MNCACTAATAARPRLPFAWQFVLPLVAVIVTYFVARLADPTALRPMLIAVLVTVAAWYSALILRNRQRAVAPLLVILAGTTIVSMYPVQWGVPTGPTPPIGLVVVGIVLLGLAWVGLIGFVLNRVGRGLAAAREDKTLGGESFVLTLLTVLGVLLTIVHLVVPLLLPAVGRSPQMFALLYRVKQFSDAVFEYRTAILLGFGLIVLGLAVIAALRREYKSTRKRQDANLVEMVGRVMVAIGRNVVQLLRSTLARLWLIVKSLTPAAIAVVASLGLVWGVFGVSFYVEKLWTHTDFFALEFGEWFVLIACVALTGAGLLVMSLAVSRDLRATLRRILTEIREDAPKLAEAYGFSAIILSFAFWCAWLAALVHKLAFEHEPFGGFVFVLATVAYVSFGVWFALRSRSEPEPELDGVFD